MAGRIPQEFIDELMNRVDIVDVIDSRVPLRKSGRDYTARCPFHEEKSPSFTVSQEKQFYHCFGCGAHGTAIGFLMQYEHLDFVEAVEELAKRAGMEVPRTGGERTAPAGPDLHALLAEAEALYRRQLRDHAEGALAIEYLKKRGLSGEIAAEFGIGYAPVRDNIIVRGLGQSRERLQQLITTGMAATSSDGRHYDRFRGRIMFPIRDRRGRVIGFGGRVVNPDDQPKYLNSPETPLFHKGRELYGLYEARQALRHIDHLLVVEGYMDVVALAQHGIRNVVATLGTALTEAHLEPLFRTAPEVVFCFDGDRAGRGAAAKALEVVLPQIGEGRQARFMFLPEGEDPDTLVRQEGRDAFSARIETAIPLSNFLLESLTKEVDMTAIDGRARLVELARPRLGRIQDPVFRHLLVEQLAERVRMAPQALMALLGPEAASGKLAAPRPAPTGGKRGGPSLVRTAITLLLQRPALAAEAPSLDGVRGLEEPGVAVLVELLETLRQRPHLHCGALLEQWRDRPEGPHLARLARQPLATPPEGMAAEFRDALLRLEMQGLEQETQRLLRQAERGGLSGPDKERLSRLLAAKGAMARRLGQ